jgi:hypothetical protein
MPVSAGSCGLRVIATAGLSAGAGKGWISGSRMLEFIRFRPAGLDAESLPSSLDLFHGV